MCRECNTKTSPDTTKDIIKYQPNLPKNLQKQMNIIINEILSGGFDPRLRAYPIYVAENIKNSSEGAIKLDIIDYCEETLKRSKKRSQIDSSYKRKNHLKPNQVEFLDKIERILQEKLTNYLSKNKKTT